MGGSHHDDVLDAVFSPKGLDINSGDDAAHAMRDDVNLVGRVWHLFSQHIAQLLGILEVAEPPIVIENDNVLVGVPDVVEGRQERRIDLTLIEQRDDVYGVDQAATVNAAIPAICSKRYT